MKISNVSLPSYPLNSFFDPGKWFHEYNHCASLFNMNAFYWDKLYNSVYNTEKKFQFITDDQDLNTEQVDEFQVLIEKLNSEQNIFLFSVSNPAYFFPQALLLNDISYYAENMPLELVDCIRSLIIEYKLFENDVVSFSIHSVFETICMYICMRELKKINENIQFLIGTTKFENFYIERQKIIGFLKISGFSIIDFSPELFKNVESNKIQHFGVDGSKIITLTVFDSKCYWQRCHFCFQSRVVIDEKEADEQLILSKLNFYVNLGVTKFLFLDECYTPEKLEYFADLIIKNNLKIQWFARLRYRTDYPKSLWKKLHKAGLVQILFGLESASPRILKIINKYDYDFEPKEFVKLAKTLRKNQILAHICFIIGFPFETAEDIKKTDEFINLMRKKNVFFSTYVNIFLWYEKANMYNDISDYITVTKQPPSDFNVPLSYIDNEKSFWSNKNVVEFQKKYVQQIKKLYWKDILLNNEIYFNCINSTGYGLFIIVNHWDKYVL